MPDEEVVGAGGRERHSRPEPTPKRKRQRGAAKVALALVETHLRGVYAQMELLKASLAELKKEMGG